MTRPQKISTLGAERLPRRRERIFARTQGELTARAANGANGAKEIAIFGELGFDGLSVGAFGQELASAPGDVCLQINSPGGDASVGIAIYNLAVQHPGNVRVEILGLAASAASIVAMAGDQIVIAPNAHLMVHRSWGLTIGNTADHTEQAALLSKIDTALARTYAQKSGQSLDRVLAMMAAETWMDADEAVQLGFATEQLGEAGPAARFDLSVYGKVPAELKRPASPETLNARSAEELRRILVERAGMTRGAAEKIAAGGWPTLQHGDKGDTEQLAARLIASADQLRNIRETMGN